MPSLFKKLTNPFVQTAQKIGQVASSVAEGQIGRAANEAVGGVKSAITTGTGLTEKQALGLALSLAVPGMGSAIGAQLTSSGIITNTVIANAVGTALASTAIQTAEGVDFETALKNATVNAVVNTGSPYVATEINNLVKIPQVSDAITSAGASALKTAAVGGDIEDIKKNIIGAVAGSATASGVEAATDSTSTGRLAGSAVGGGITGGTAGALTSLAGEYASQAAADAARLEAQKGTKLASADTGTMFDTGEQLGNVVVKGERPITDTNIILPSDITTKKTPVAPSKSNLPELSEVEVTGKRDIQDTTIVSPDVLPEVKVTGEREEEPTEEPKKIPPDQYKPNLFIYSKTKPKSQTTLPKTLSTALPTVPTTGTTVGLTGERGAGEIESQETGKKRQNVWNEASLRLKDALGV